MTSFQSPMPLDKWMIVSNKNYYQRLAEEKHESCRLAAACGDFYAKRMFGFLKDHDALPPGSRILEMGPGDGHATRNFLKYAESISGVQYCCAGFSEQELESARQRLGSNGMRFENVSVGIGTKLPFTDNFFDLCVTNEFFDDLPVKVVRNYGKESLYAFPEWNNPGFRWDFVDCDQEEEQALRFAASRGIKLGAGQKMLYTGTVDALKEVSRVLKPGGFLCAMDYVCSGDKVPQQPYCIDVHYPFANITTPLDRDLFVNNEYLSLVSSKSFSDFFRGTPEGETRVAVGMLFGVVYPAPNGTPLWKLLDSLKRGWIPDMDYHVFLSKKTGGR